MKVLEVSKEDCKCAAQLINMIQVAAFETNGKDICAAADALRWLQNVAVDMAKAFQGASKDPVVAETPPLEPPPAAPEKSSFKIKSSGRAKA